MNLDQRFSDLKPTLAIVGEPTLSGARCSEVEWGAECVRRQPVWDGSSNQELRESSISSPESDGVKRGESATSQLRLFPSVAWRSVCRRTHGFASRAYARFAFIGDDSAILWGNSGAGTVHCCISITISFQKTTCSSFKSEATRKGVPVSTE